MTNDEQEYTVQELNSSSTISERDDETLDNDGTVLTEEHHVPYAIKLLFDVTEHWTLEVGQVDPVHLKVVGDRWFSEYDNGSKMNSPKDVALTAVVHAIQGVATRVTSDDLHRWVGGFTPDRLSDPKFVQIAMDQCSGRIKTRLVEAAQKGGYAALLKLAEPLPG